MNRKTVVLSLSAIGLTISFTGVISGTTAWYAYATRASLSYGGTSVSNTEQLQIGLKIDEENFSSQADLDSFIHGLEEKGRTHEKLNGKDYVFRKPGSPLSSNILSYYLSGQGYASNSLYPVTTKDFDWDSTSDSYQKKSHSDFKLYSSLYAGETNQKEAKKEEYVYLPFAFRVLKIGHLSDPVYSKNQNIWLSDAQAVATNSSGEEDSTIKDALRIFVETDHEEDFLLAPTSKEESVSYTTVAGLLDLNHDGYYDYDSYEFGSREVLYGTYAGNKNYTKNPEVSGQEKVDNINSVSDQDPILDNCFLAKHRSGVNRINDYSSLKRGKAYYETRKTVAPDRVQGKLSGGKVLCTTSDDEAAVAEVGFTLYREGWDHQVTDNTLESRFSLGLTFEINKVS